MILAIGGASRSGKSTLARLLVNHFRDSGKTAIVLYQDDFVFPTSQIPKVRDKVDWENPASINHELFREMVKFYSSRFEILILDGFLIYHDPKLGEIIDKRIFVNISKETFLKRKELDLRWGDIPRWFFEHIWESYKVFGIPNFEENEYLRISGETEYNLDKVLEILN